MSYVASALHSLNVTDWVCEGTPTTEQQFNSSFKKIVGTTENGTAILSSDPNDFGVTWQQLKQKRDELAAAEPLENLRNKRNDLLAETDWWASSDLTMTAEQTAYRQALRDITNTYTSLDDVAWPEKP
jgi:hypothetical protein